MMSRATLVRVSSIWLSSRMLTSKNTVLPKISRMTPTSVEYRRVRRRRRDMIQEAALCRAAGLSGIFSEHVAHAAYRMNEPWLIIGLQLLAQVADVDFQHVALAAEVITPDAVEYDLAS